MTNIHVVCGKFLHYLDILTYIYMNKNCMQSTKIEIIQREDDAVKNKKPQGDSLMNSLLYDTHFF